MTESANDRLNRLAAAAISLPSLFLLFNYGKQLSSINLLMMLATAGGGLTLFMYFNKKVFATGTISDSLEMLFMACRAVILPIRGRLIAVAIVVAAEFIATAIAQQGLWGAGFSDGLRYATLVFVFVAMARLPGPWAATFLLVWGLLDLALFFTLPIPIRTGKEILPAQAAWIGASLGLCMIFALFDFLGYPLPYDEESIGRPVADD